MVSFRILNSDGTPARKRRVIVKNPGHWDYGLSGQDGTVEIPHIFPSGELIVGGRTVYQGDLVGDIYLP